VEDALAEIQVSRSDVERSALRFHVTVRDGGSATAHDVTVSADDLERLGSHHRSPEDFVFACFEFLLEREPKESILSEFDVSVIGRYFPEFESRIRDVET
jgi:hypothetical protein